MKIAMIIVFYNCKLEESSTLYSLKNIHNTNFNYSMHLWNNGSNSIAHEFEYSNIIKLLKQKGIQITFHEDLANAPLSIIYNKLIDNNLDCDRFVILDHDTQITDSYINAIINQPTDIDLILPHITDEHTKKLVAPTDKGKVVLVDGDLSLDKPGSVSSGLAISNRLISIVKRYYQNTIFDEHYALYGIDSTFLMRIRKIAKKENIIAKCEGNLVHSLSLSLEEDKAVKSFRSAELSYDKTLTLRHYPSFGKLKTFLRDLKKIRQGKSLLTTKDVLYCLWTGYHPRCIKYKKNNP